LSSSFRKSFRTFYCLTYQAYSQRKIELKPQCVGLIAANRVLKNTTVTVGNVDYIAPQYHKVFNKNFMLGGRAYPPLQTAKKEDRKFINQ
jgi:hypothetical protein